MDELRQELGKNIIIKRQTSSTDHSETIAYYGKEIPELKLVRYGLSERQRRTALLYGGSGPRRVSELVSRLEEIYCGNISYEFGYLEVSNGILYLLFFYFVLSRASRAKAKEWFAKRIESDSDAIDKDRRIEIAKELLHSQAWDKFLSVKFPTVKRYCGEAPRAC
ncbi:Probable 2-oxoglutarate dehydrogenase E1 component DHKTD1 homolog, mitochondrial [Eumeta japonica]|uniref:Probable 2-oxoglutarate dehydrogenase E1 component DHKTD1 homolog, mitochondrial n=1 Tax=Eumeta variegata TaxID=151549 RepID=A0A4C2A4F8_EUMVA|nr:Probable 2-oxoglutarate dehydrogenase E1 component DHKTD1 homolog, mitochondrial [Eumeta japonica]